MISDVLIDVRSLSISYITLSVDCIDCIYVLNHYTASVILFEDRSTVRKHSLPKVISFFFCFFVCVCVGGVMWNNVIFLVVTVHQCSRCTDAPCVFGGSFKQPCRGGRFRSCCSKIPVLMQFSSFNLIMYTASM